MYIPFHGRIAALAVLLVSLTSATLHGQVPHEQLWPGLQGNQLLDSVRVHYKPVVILDYTRARDEMYRYIDNYDGELVCLYTAQTAQVSQSTTTPRADAGNQNFNAEHIYPQSMGADTGNANSDLHHLRPTNANVNSSRGNLAFGFVAASSTNRWWSGTVSQTTTPSGDLGVWSRTGSTRFEPRDEVKGDVARSAFYFFAMYTDQALAANASFFDLMKDELLTFHRQDEVTTAEYARTQRAAEFQEGKINPFILDTTLVSRIFFTEDNIGDPGDPGEPGDALLAQFSFSGTIDCNNQDNAPSGQVDGAMISDFGRTGIRCNAGGGIFNSAGWPVTTTIDTGFYAGFTITAEDPQVKNLVTTDGDELRFNIRRSTTGPQQLLVRYSTDGTNFTDLGSTGVPTSDNLITLDMPEISGADYLEFRFYAWGGSSSSGTLRFNLVEAEFETVTSTHLEGAEAGLPQVVSLAQNFPNPFNPTTSIAYSLPADGQVRLEVFSATGQRVAVLEEGYRSAGEHQVVFNAGELASGMYLYRLQTSAGVVTRKMTLVK